MNDEREEQAVLRVLSFKFILDAMFRNRAKSTFS